MSLYINSKNCYNRAAHLTLQMLQWIAYHQAEEWIPQKYISKTLANKSYIIAVHSSSSAWPFWQTIWKTVLKMHDKVLAHIMTKKEMEVKIKKTSKLLHLMWTSLVLWFLDLHCHKSKRWMIHALISTIAHWQKCTAWCQTQKPSLR